MLYHLLWQNLRAGWQGCQLWGMPFTTQSMEWLSVLAAHLCAAAQSFNWAPAALYTSSGIGAVKRGWVWSREVFPRFCFSSQAKPFLLVWVAVPGNVGDEEGSLPVSAQEHGGWETGGGGEWAQGDAKRSRESIISEPL